MAKNKKNTRGITLIALVITIIVLLILAGVTIAALSGDNGILTKAKEAKEKTEQAQKDEEQTLSNMENMLGVYKFKNIDTADTNPAEVVPENSIVLEDDANNGIVIKDQNNNEWVWIEVPKTTVFPDLTLDTTTELTEQNYNDIRDKLIQYVGVYRNGAANQTRSDWKDEWYAKDGEILITANTENLTDAQKNLKNGCGLTYYEYKKAYQKMLKSIYTYGGFWIGRYEAGIEGSIEDISKARKSTSERITIGKSAKAISQKDAIPYNFIYCNEAQALAKEMSPDNNYTSSLIFGIQWDLACKFLEKNTELTTNDINVKSIKWGNYRDAKIENLVKGKYAVYDGVVLGDWTKITNSYTKEDTGNNYKTVLSTGISEYTNRMNIYDFAGNEWEFTLEYATTRTDYPCAGRGGSCTGTSYEYPTSCRSIFSISDYNLNLGFRSVLYL